LEVDRQSVVDGLGVIRDDNLAGMAAYLID
jgi:hypothetical protein